ncbi:MAG: polymer-forming cytoskeletal protein [Kiloniellaceae bacterium]
MNMNNPSRRAGAATDATAGAAMGVRPGAGVLGLTRSEAAAAEEPSSQGTLIVGEGIHVKGEIQSCTTLVVEGRVEASLEATELAVHEGGFYDGKAVVETATIGGSVTGELTVRGLLTVAAGGSVSGVLRYGELRIEQGGRLSGDVDELSEDSARKVDPRDAAKAVSKAQAQGQALSQTAAERPREERPREGAVAR